MLGIVGSVFDVSCGVSKYRSAAFEWHAQPPYFVYGSGGGAQYLHGTEHPE